MRLHKFISRSGVASRRKAEVMISEGRVTVNSEIIKNMGMTIDPEIDNVAVDGKPIGILPIKWVKVNKPKGFLTTAKDDRGRPVLYDLLPNDMRSLRYVGRLDYLTEGLLILTNAGDAANRLQHPRYGIEREYEVAVEQEVSEMVLERLRAGVVLEDGFARPSTVEIDRNKDNSLKNLRLVLIEGRNREVRRLMAAVGCSIAHLKRTRFGPIELGWLKVGHYEMLTPDEVEPLTNCSSLV